MYKYIGSGVPNHLVCFGGISPIDGGNIPPCRMVATKPGTEPREYIDWITAAAELDDIQRSGGVFPYPNSLTVWEWTALRAIRASRQRDEGREKEEPPAPTKGSNIVGQRMVVTAE